MRKNTHFRTETFAVLAPFLPMKIKEVKNLETFFQYEWQNPS